MGPLGVVGLFCSSPSSPAQQRGHPKIRSWVKVPFLWLASSCEGLHYCSRGHSEKVAVHIKDSLCLHSCCWLIVWPLEDHLASLSLSLPICKVVSVAPVGALVWVLLSCTALCTWEGGMILIVLLWLAFLLSCYYLKYAHNWPFLWQKSKATAHSDTLFFDFCCFIHFFILDTFQYIQKTTENALMYP